MSYDFEEMHHKAIVYFRFSIILSSYFLEGTNSVNKYSLVRNLFNKNTQSKHPKKRQEWVASNVGRRLTVFCVLPFSNNFFMTVMRWLAGSRSTPPFSLLNHGRLALHFSVFFSTISTKAGISKPWCMWGYHDTRSGQTDPFLVHCEKPQCLNSWHSREDSTMASRLFNHMQSFFLPEDTAAVSQAILYLTSCLTGIRSKLSVFIAVWRT